MRNSINQIDLPHQEILQNIAEISFDDTIIPGTKDATKIAAYEEERHKDELRHLEEGIIDPFMRTIVIILPLRCRDKKWNSLQMQCKIWSRTVQNLSQKEIIENIRKAGSIDLLDIDFEFTTASAQYSAYYFWTNPIYLHLKEQVKSYIKKYPPIEKAVVNNYCASLSATLHRLQKQEPLIKQREKTSEELYKSLWRRQEKNKPSECLVTEAIGDTMQTYHIPTTPKQKAIFQKVEKIKEKVGWFRQASVIKDYIETSQKNEEEIKNQIMLPLKNEQKDIDIDSKFFFLDNGDTLYEEIIQESSYHKRYIKELELLSKKAKQLRQYIKTEYISLWCGNGAKDFVLLEETLRKGAMLWWFGGSLHYRDIPQEAQKIIFMDSSIKSLSKAEKLLSDSWFLGRGVTNSWFTDIYFTQGRIDILCENKRLSLLNTIVGSPRNYEINKVDIRETTNTFSLFWGTFGNFWAYKPIFLQQIASLMNHGDTLYISLFNKPKTSQEIQNIVETYKSPQTTAFIKNFFMKLGLPKEAMEVTYDYDKNNTMQINLAYDNCVFHCIQSQRMDREDLEEMLKSSKSSLKIIDEITESDNPFTIYVLQKQ